MKKRICKGLKVLGILLLVFVSVNLIRPTWTPKIEGENSISELRMVEINGENIQVMIRGCDRNNPILLFVHGGPCWPEIPYVVKYQKEWEEEFTIVHYDQRGCGKSYQFFRDYEDVSATTHVEDLIALTEYIMEYLGQKQVILVGHSFGTYIATNVVYQKPELYRAYVGIGQVSNEAEAELDNLNKYISAAEASGNTKDVNYLKKLQESVKNGDRIAPRGYARKYGFAARKMYDGMTSPKAAEEYLDDLICHQGKEFILFEESAHFPQFEEKQKFYQWMKKTFKEY